MTDTSSFPTSTHGWQSIHDPHHDCRILQRGRHCDGTFVRVYAPMQAEASAQAERSGQPRGVILYLHGFALCLPDFYDAHMRSLAQQGWVVIFPDFQRSSYRESQLAESKEPATFTPQTEKKHPNWLATTAKILFQQREVSLLEKDLPEQMRPRIEEEYDPVASALPELRVKDLRRVLLPWLLIRLLLSVIGWFRRRYARNLGELIGTVLISLAYAPEDWLRNAMVLADHAWQDLCSLPPYGHWRSQRQRVYGFGHSLGGLLALSLPYLKHGDDGTHLQPEVILASDPATSTEMGIPSFVVALLKLFNSPFTAAPLDIHKTGPLIDIPVAILHGLDDTIVPPQRWATEGGTGGFAAIASPDKALYFASSNRQQDPGLVAFHNQAVTSTQTYDDALFASFGGVKDGPNAYNFSWIWPALLKLFSSQPIAPSQLLHHLPPPPFAVSSDPPPPRQRHWVGLRSSWLSSE